MRNKRAFTLIELLAVIVILAILAIITIPIISNIITNVRIKSLESSAYGLIEASNLYYVSNEISITTRFDKNENEDTLRELKYKGSVKEGTVVISKKGQVTVCITDGKNSAYKNYNENKVTTVKGVHCSIKDNSSIVYLDDEATIKELSIAELTEKVLNLEMKYNNIYPVGSVYISMTDDTVEKVQNRFGGTWEALEDGRMLQNTTTTSGQTGGQSSYSYTPVGTVGDTTLTVDQMPSHQHMIYLQRYSDGKHSSPIKSGGMAFYADSLAVDYDTFFWGVYGSIAGNSQPHNHSFIGTAKDIPTVSPYITVYMYKRIS